MNDGSEYNYDSKERAYPTSAGIVGLVRNTGPFWPMEVKAGWAQRSRLLRKVISVTKFHEPYTFT